MYAQLIKRDGESRWGLNVFSNRKFASRQAVKKRLVTCGVDAGIDLLSLAINPGWFVPTCNHALTMRFLIPMHDGASISAF
jgi:hypothetical protein